MVIAFVFTTKPFFFCRRGDFTLGSVISFTFSQYLACRITSEYFNYCKLSDAICTLDFVGVFYYLPNVNDFIVEILIGSVNSQVMHVFLS